MCAIIWAITAEIKRHKLIIKKKMKYNKITMLGKTKLNTIEILIFHGEFFSENMRQVVKDPNNR